MRRQSVVATIAVLAVTAAGFAWAQPGEGGKGQRGAGSRNPEQRMEKMIQKLELTDQQADQVRAIYDSGKSDRDATRKELARLRNQIEAEMLKDDINKNTLIGLTKQVGDTRTQVAVKRIEQMFEISEILTPEQRETFLSMRGQRGGHGGRHGRGGGHGR